MSQDKQKQKGDKPRKGGWKLKGLGLAALLAAITGGAWQFGAFSTGAPGEQNARRRVNQAVENTVEKAKAKAGEAVQKTGQAVRDVLPKRVHVEVREDAYFVDDEEKSLREVINLAKEQPDQPVTIYITKSGEVGASQALTEELTEEGIVFKQEYAEQ